MAAQQYCGVSAILVMGPDGSLRSNVAIADALQMHRGLIFGQSYPISDAGISEMEHRQSFEDFGAAGVRWRIAKSNQRLLRCRVRYFSDGRLILGRSRSLHDFDNLRGFVDVSFVFVFGISREGPSLPTESEAFARR